MVFAAAGCRFRANLELRRQLYARGDRRRSACDAGLWQAAGDQQHRQDVAPAAYFAAGIVAVMAEDCGPCTQLAIDMAQQGGVDPAVLRAVVTRDFKAMPTEAALAVRFTEATLRHAPEADELREEVEASAA